MRRMLQVSTLMLALAMAAGSATMVGGKPRQIDYSPASTQQYPGLPPDCPITVLSTPPQQAYQEVGTFDVRYGRSDESDLIRTAAELRRTLGPEACRLGANALIGFTANYSGTVLYTRAVAVRWLEAPASALAPPVPTTTPAPPPAPAPAQPY